MNLETVLTGTVDKAEEFIDELPWYAQLFYRPQVSEVRNILQEQRVHISNYEATESWFLQQGELLNRAYTVAQNTVDKTYDFVDAALPLYEQVRGLPFVGYWIENKVEGVKSRVQEMGGNLVGKGANVSIPSRATTRNVATTGYSAALAGLCSTAAAETGLSYDHYWSQLYREPEVRQYDFSVLSYVSSAIDAVNSFFGELFGPSPAT